MVNAYFVADSSCFSAQAECYKCILLCICSALIPGQRENTLFSSLRPGIKTSICCTYMYILRTYMYFVCIPYLYTGVVDYLDTQVSPSKQKKFGLVTFIDSPGLVDGDMKYPFDVNEAIVTLGNMADLIFVLFDPLGQALCKRTLNILGKVTRHNYAINLYIGTCASTICMYVRMS